MLGAATNLDAVALSPAVGWLLLLCAAAGAGLAILGREGWRRWWLTTEDPRPLALFRIALALLVLIDIDSLGEQLLFLFSDEGLLSADNAQELFAPAQFRGYGDGHAGEPRGFFGLSGLAQHFTDARFSALFFWDSPTAVWIHLALFNLAGVAMAIGLWTRTAAALTFALFCSLLHRDPIFWEGTELILRCLLFYVVVSRSGHALSVDNWLRCRRLRRAGALSIPGGPGDGAGAPPSPAHPRGLAAIYRQIPAWPRRLMILQIAALYFYTGAVKNGPVWAAGDALYYALNLDHFYRFYPQAMSAALATSLFRLMTWVTKIWELLFPLVVVGMIVRWRRRQALPEPPPRSRRLAAALWIILSLGALAIALITLPVHVAAPPEGPAVAPLQLGLAVAWILLMIGVAGLVRALRRGAVRLGRWTIDADRLLAWTLGRRIWLTVGVVFQLHLLVLMSIGVFQPIMLAANLLFLDGSDARIILGWLRIPGAALPAEDPRLPHLARDPTPLPRAALALALALAIIGVVAQALSGGAIGWRGFGALILVGLVVHVLRRAPAAAPPDPALTPAIPFAYGPLGRLLVGALTLVHCVAVALWLVPDKGSTAAFREPARRVFQPWLRLTQTTQSWGMFAPNPPRANAFLKVVVVDPRGDAWDLRTDVYAAENFQIPLLGYDRRRKINRRILNEERYRPWVARYYCRRWALERGGEVPHEVRLIRYGYAIPPPEELAAAGPYEPMTRLREHGFEHAIHREFCVDAPEGQPSDELRARFGLPPAPPGTYIPNAKRRLAAWRGEDDDDDDE
ncbi:MAG: hypothetical protein R3A79_24865 [Nannocystaceae bacterium]